MIVITVVGTRPEIIRLSRVMAALDKYFDGQRDEHTLRLLSTNVSFSHV